MAMKILESSEQTLTQSDGTAFGTLAAAGAAQQSEIVAIQAAVQGRRTIALRVRYVGGTGAATGRPHVRLWVSAADQQPAIGDTSWAPVGTTDGLIVGGVAFAGGAAVNNEVTISADLMKVGPPVAANAVIALWLKLSIEFGLWLYAEVAEIGDTGHPGTITLAAVQE